MDLPECPVCMNTMCAPIFQCGSGHSLCHSCTKELMPPVCPICRQTMTQMRNWQLEELIAKAKVPCPNKNAGCVYTMVGDEVEEHLKECIFRMMDCPLGKVFGKCSWSGKLTNIMDHFKERHENQCNVSSDTDIILNNVSVKEDDRHVYLLAQGKLLFLFTVKIDTLQKFAYWTIQHIGSRTVARQHIYEIHITSRQDSRRKAVFIDHCFNDAITADEVFRLGKCAILPLDVLTHFIKDKTISFRFFLKRLPGPPKNKNNSDNKNENKPPNKGFKPGPKGPGPNNPGPKGPGPKGQGPGPKGQGPGPKKAYKANA